MCHKVKFDNFDRWRGVCELYWWTHQGYTTPMGGNPLLHWLACNEDVVTVFTMLFFLYISALIGDSHVMGWGSKAIEIRAVENGQLDGVFMHKRTQKLRFLCEKNDKVYKINSQHFIYIHLLSLSLSLFRCFLPVFVRPVTARSTSWRWIAAWSPSSSRPRPPR